MNNSSIEEIEEQKQHFAMSPIDFVMHSPPLINNSILKVNKSYCYEYLEIKLYNIIYFYNLYYLIRIYLLYYTIIY